MRKLFTKKGSAEMVSIILGIVVIGGLALAVTGTFSNQGNKSFKSGMDAQTKQMETNFNSASTQSAPSEATLNEVGNVGNVE